MRNESDEAVVNPLTGFARQMQQASEDFTEQQMALFRNALGGGSSVEGSMRDLRAISTGAAVFKTRVQSGGRISIPDAEREAIGIEEGDLVQAFVIPLNRDDPDE